MLLSPAVEGSPQVLRLSQQAEDALLLTSPADAGRFPPIGVGTRRRCSVYASLTQLTLPRQTLGPRPVALIPIHSYRLLEFQKYCRI